MVERPPVNLAYPLTGLRQVPVVQAEAMSTIEQLGSNVEVTIRAVRHYRHIGLHR